MNNPTLYIETDRLIMRPFMKKDFTNTYNGFHNRLPSQSKYDEGYSDMSTFTEEWFDVWVQLFEEKAKKDEMYNLGVFRKEDGANIGKVELIPILRMDYQWAMMGYTIHNQYWKMGYGLESVVAAREAFFHELNIHRIELHINLDNQPSKQLAEKAGFEFECIRKEFSLENDKWTDFMIYYKNKEG